MSKSYKSSLKSENFTNRVLTKLRYLRQSAIILQAVCGDVRPTLLSTIYTVNESNRKTSIEHDRSLLTCNVSSRLRQSYEQFSLFFLRSNGE